MAIPLITLRDALRALFQLRFLVRIATALFCVGTSLLSAATEPIDWPTVSLTEVVTNVFKNPTVITHAGDKSDRLFIGSQKGQIWIIQNGQTLPDPFLDIADRVNSVGAEQGLLGIAFPPGYATNHHFYVHYTAPRNAIVVSRFTTTDNPNVADPATEQILFTIPKVDIRHNGGQLAFGPDGYLYIGIGDGGPEADPGNVAQQTTNFFGKILRIDVENGGPTYSVPSNNPFVGNPKDRPELWAYGLRNPWRFSFDRANGDLYIGDVGQGAIEEINFQPAGSPGGQNYGWRIMEGPQNFNVPPTFTNFSSLTMPVASYSHQMLLRDGAGSVTGGYVYRGSQSSRMDGMYFFGDFIAGWIWGMKQSGADWQTFPLIKPTYGAPHYWISAFGEDEQGELYLADYYAGKILRLSDCHQTWAPVFSPATGPIPTDTLLVTSPTANAELHYTINGDDPTPADPMLPADGQLKIEDGDTVKARAFRFDLPPSPVTTGTFTFQVGRPVIAPLPPYRDSNVLPRNTVMTIQSSTPSATIYFTTNGAPPTVDSPIFTGPFTINPPITIAAIATAPGFANSVTAYKNYSVAPAATPVFVPGSGFVTNGTLISIFTATSGATIHYTVDQSFPTVDSPVYTGPFPVTANTLVRAIATAPDYLNSQSQAALYNMLNPRIDSVAPMADDTIQVRWQTRSGQNYILQVSHDLISWNDIGDPISGDGNIATVIDDTPFASSDQRFYRILQTP